MTDISYTVDSETQTLLEAVLNLAVQVAELQYEDSAKEGIYELTETLADRFGIEVLAVEVETGTDEEGRTVTVIRHEADSEPDEPDGTVH